MAGDTSLWTCTTNAADGAETVVLRSAAPRAPGRAHDRFVRIDGAACDARGMGGPHCRLRLVRHADSTVSFAKGGAAE